jgi:hypothetical protein
LTVFATFWRGPLSALARACLATFPARGAPLLLYSYEPLALPPGVEPRDAREIVPDPATVERYHVAGKFSAATFADRFRYELLTRADVCWVDADMILLRPVDLSAPKIWGRQPEAKGKALINNAVLRLPPGDPVLAEMLARARAAEGAEIGWGAIGPYLLTDIAEAHGVDATASPPSRFFAVAPDDFWTLFDPASRAEVAQAAAGADMLHLWSELLRRMNWDFDAAPPPGAYLHDLFAQIGALPFFSRTASAGEVEALKARWRAGAPK